MFSNLNELASVMPTLSYSNQGMQSQLNDFESKMMHNYTSNYNFGSSSAPNCYSSSFAENTSETPKHVADSYCLCGLSQAMAFMIKSSMGLAQPAAQRPL